jgi:glycosyltransferase involved in cell wall biosynthesis
LSKILINGFFLCRTLTGVERYAFEITKRLDTISRPGEISIIIPADCKNIPCYKNINIIKHKKKIPHILWQFITLQSFLLANKQYTILEFGNTALPFAPGIVFLHDIYCEFFPEDFCGFRDKLVRLYNRWQYRLIAHHAKRIVTVSNFSKNQIAQTYHIDPKRISVIYNSWNHFGDTMADYSIFSEHPNLAVPFYFSLGSLSKRKNIKWLIQYAAKHPKEIFAISGARMPTSSDKELDGASLSNIILLGYVSDQKVKALFECCKAFVMPSYYEGFGIPPLEALYCGAKIIISNAASLPEIYGNTAHYIDPYNTDVDIDEILKEPVEPPDAILDKYSYDTAASQVYDIIQDVTTRYAHGTF